MAAGHDCADDGSKVKLLTAADIACTLQVSTSRAYEIMGEIVPRVYIGRSVRKRSHAAGCVRAAFFSLRLAVLMASDAATMGLSAYRRASSLPLTHSRTHHAGSQASSREMANERDPWSFDAHALMRRKARDGAFWGRAHRCHTRPTELA